MADYKEKFEKWQQDAKERFDDFDKQLGLKEKFEEGKQVAKETAKRSAETLKDGAQKIRAEAEKSEVGKQAARVAEDTFKTADQTAKKAWDASEPLRNAAGDASGNAADMIAASTVEAEKLIKEVGKQAEAVFNVAANRAGAAMRFAGAKLPRRIFPFARWELKPLKSQASNVRAGKHH